MFSFAFSTTNSSKSCQALNNNFQIEMCIQFGRRYDKLAKYPTFPSLYDYRIFFYGSHLLHPAVLLFQAQYHGMLICYWNVNPDLLLSILSPDLLFGILSEV